MDFSERLKELRTKRGYSQYDLAKKLGIAKSTISMMEIGNRQPSTETMELIADFFNVTLDYLMGKDDVSFYFFEPEQSELLNRLIADEELYALVDKAVRSEELRNKLIQMARLLEM